MKKRNMLRLFLLLLTACSGGAGSTEGEPGRVTEGVTLVSLLMCVRPDTLPPVAPKVRLSEDPNRPTVLTQVTVLDNAVTDSGSYGTGTH